MTNSTNSIVSSWNLYLVNTIQTENAWHIYLSLESLILHFTKFNFVQSWTWFCSSQKCMILKKRPIHHNKNNTIKTQPCSKILLWLAFFTLIKTHSISVLIIFLAATTVPKKSTTRLRLSIGYDNTSSTITSSQLLQWHFQCKKERALKIGNSFTEIKLRKFSSSLLDSYFRSRCGEYVSEQQCCEAGKWQLGSEQQQRKRFERQNFVNDYVKLCHLDCISRLPAFYTSEGFTTMDGEEECWKM